MQRPQLRFLLLAGALTLLGAACRSADGGPRRSAAALAADATLFTDGRIYLGAPDWGATDALLVRDGRVVALGDAAREQAGSARTVSLGGATALPGLQDAHGHFGGYGQFLEEVDLTDTRSYGEVVAAIAERAATLPPGAWVTGRGWDQTRWPENAFPHHAALSEAVPDRPVLVRRVDGHAALANRAALAAAGLHGDLGRFEQPEGGRVVVGADGWPTGVLIDEAMALVGALVPAPTEADLVRRAERAQEALFAVGLTCVHDMGVSRRDLDVLRRMRDDGRLRLRLVAYLWGNDGDLVTLAQGLPWAPDARDVLCAPGVKLMVDGALGSRGAALLEDYHDAPGERGLVRLSPVELGRRVAQCAELGLQPAVHAIGDRANRSVLDAFAAANELLPGFRALRPRVEHAQVVARDDWERFARLGAVPSMQPTHATSDMRWAEERLGARRVQGAYAPKRLAPRTFVLALGSDFPVERPHPLEGVYAAVTRTDRDGAPPGGWMPEQRLDVRAALEGFTLGAARAVRQEDRRGRLALGYFADLTVLDRDPLEVPPEELLRTRVVMTVVNGAVVYGGQ